MNDLLIGLSEKISEFMKENDVKDEMATELIIRMYYDLIVLASKDKSDFCERVYLHSKIAFDSFEKTKTHMKENGI